MRYNHRKAGVNPRTGEQLPPWSEVQVTNPERGAWRRVLVKVKVATESGGRTLDLLTPTPAGEDPKTYAAALAKSLGFSVLSASI